MTKEPDWDDIELAAKVIGHISQGMYRSAAGAIKELISNAYDAGATRVKIHTGFPRFSEFSCEDNGTGIAFAEFKRLMAGGIGDSTKHTPGNNERGLNGRPVIGRLGVGLLSLAQICSQFTIISHHPKSKTAFRAFIKFPPYTRQQIDQVIAELKKTGKPFVKGGQFRTEDLDYDSNQAGVKVTTVHLREPFRKTMSSLSNLGYFKTEKRIQSYPSFDDFIKAIMQPEVSTLSFASPYDSLLFGLALASPIPYLEIADGNATEPVLLQVPQLRKLQNTLKSYDFSVEVDNIELRRVVNLPSNKRGVLANQCLVPQKSISDKFLLKDGEHEEEPKIEFYEIKVENSDEKFQLYYFDYNTVLNGMTLDFSGYIFMQTTRLYPKEYQGVLIRIRNVAIGEYDVNVMTYPKAEGPRFSMLSAEVFVHQGLDDALKVDRDGFNTLDPHYIRLQAYLHNILHEKIFPGSWGEEKERNAIRREVKAKEKAKRFISHLVAATGRAITKVEFHSEKVDASSSIIEVDPSGKRIIINSGHPDARHILGKKKYRQVAAQILVAFELSNGERTPEKRKASFYELMGGLFDD